MTKILQKQTIAALILNFNHEKFLKNTLTIICKQKFPFDEILLIDDCSDDNSVSIAKKLFKNIQNARIIINDKNLGIIANLNKGTKLLKSDFIYFVSSDDLYTTHITKIFQNIISKYPHVAMIAGNVGRKTYKFKTIENLVLPFKGINPICCPKIYKQMTKKTAITFFGGGNIIRKNVIISNGMFKESLKWYSDWYLYQLIGFSENVAITNENFMTHKITKDSYSNKSLHWKEQEKIFHNFFNLITVVHNNFYLSFKNGAILPFYDIRTLHYFIFQKKYRNFLTPLLLWRILTYSIFKSFNSYVPQIYKQQLRSFLRI